MKRCGWEVVESVGLRVGWLGIIIIVALTP